MTSAGLVAVWERLVASVSLLMFIAVVTALVVFRRELRALLARIKLFKYKDFSAEFDKAVEDAFAAAAAKLWTPLENELKSRKDPDLYFSDDDFSTAKKLEKMMPIRRWMPVPRLQVRRSIRTQVYDLAERFHNVRADTVSDERTKRQSAVVARMRMLALAGFPMIPELMRADRVGGRIAAIAFLQVRPCYKASTLVWLGERISPRERRLVQYHAAGALLIACQNAEPHDMKALRRVIKDATEACEEMAKMGPDITSERAPELLDWCQKALNARRHYPEADPGLSGRQATDLSRFGKGKC